MAVLPVMTRLRPRPAPRRAEVPLTIGALGARGDGIAEYQGRKVYVPLAAPGDRVLVRLGDPLGDGIAGEPVELLAAGPDRAEPPCPHFGTCGGCLLQHLTPAAYEDWKRHLLVQALARRGFDRVDIAPTVTVPPDSRRRRS